MHAKEVSRLTNVSVRSLHHYDEIGLIKPKRNKESNYREYSDLDLDTLQQILFFKECGFSLAQIKEIMMDPKFDRLAAFELQKKHLNHEIKRLVQMIDTIDQSILNMKGEINMSKKEKFKGFDFSKNPYEEEAKARWGKDAVQRSQSFVDGLNKTEKQQIEQQMNQIFSDFASLTHLNPEDEIVLKKVDEFYLFLNTNFNYHYSLEAFQGLGQMYVQDERFKQNIDFFKEGLAEFLALAMQVYANKSN